MKQAFPLFLAGALAVSSQAAAPQLTKTQSDFFESKIRPVLVEHCYKCHSATADKVKGGLLMDTKQALLKGGESGPALVPGNAEKSLLIKAISYKDDNLQMPPQGKKLSDQQIADLTAWVRMGAPDPRTGQPQISNLKSQNSKNHWAFQPVKKQVPPAVKDAAWVKSPVDNFILARLEAKDIKPSAPADKRTLIRRAYFDLTGLPPTPQEVEAFASDTSPDAFAKVVDKLLASPRYGERWGRYWLDVARYSDTKGSVRRNREDDKLPYAWTYRDYVIKAFNDDKPYNRFIVEQLAADKMQLGNDRAALAAMGFLTVGDRFMNNQNDIINDRIDTTTKAFLGLTVACARCHDHKFDPVPTADYYSLHGIFASSTMPEELPIVGKPADEKAFASYQNEVAALKKQEAALEAQERAAKKSRDKKAAKKLQYQSVDLDRKLSTIASVHPGSPPRAMVMVDRPRVADSPIFVRGEAENKGPVVPRRFIEVLSSPARPPYRNGSGRLELALNIADPKNPLTTRVAVNRVWLHHFGEGIVTTPDDFGVMSDPPSHPELLDFLAAYFVEHDWSFKELHRLLMNSAAYQQSSAGNPKYAQLDPNNRLLWRANIRKLDFEVLRDSFLHVGGKLDLKMGGPGVDLFREGTSGYSTRRSVYGYIDREALPEVLNHFDFATPDMATGKRYATIVPQQSLFLMNSPLVVEQARNLVRRAEFTAAKSDEDKLAVLYNTVYSRPPRAEETRLALAYLKDTKPYRAVVAAAAPAENSRFAARKAQAQGNKKRPEAYIEPFKARAPLNSWEELAHTLLIANEASFVN